MEFEISRSLRNPPSDHIWSLESFWENWKKSIFFIFSSSEAGFSKDFLIKVLIEATKKFFSKNSSVKSKFCFLQIFLMVLAHSELEEFVHMTKIEKQVRFWNYLIFGGFGASQRATNIHQTKGSNFVSDLHQFCPKNVSLSVKKASKNFSNPRKRITDLLFGVFWTMKSKRRHCIFNVILA